MARDFGIARDRDCVVVGIRTVGELFAKFDELLRHGLDSLRKIIDSAIPHVGIEVVSMATVEPEQVEWLLEPTLS